MADNAPHVAYPDQAWQGVATVEENVLLARDTYRIRLECAEIARRVVPGQFIMMRLPGLIEPLLGRPLALYDVATGEDGEPRVIDIVYVAIGKMTRRLAHVLPGAPIEVWGPLGNGFPPTETDHLVMVAGGIGQTPFLALAREYLGQHRYGDPPRRVPQASQVTLCYGVSSADRLAGVEDFQRIGVDVHVATEDGTAGHHGLATELLRPVVESSRRHCRVVCCGPEGMMAATALIARELGVRCQVSLETPMACGIGICFSCVAKIRDPSGGWDYRRTCVEGPVFEAEEVQFE